MKYYAVIDTNVIVSAYLHWDSVPGNLMDAVYDGRIIPVISKEIEAEYREVLSRKKFSFPSETTAPLFDFLEKCAVVIEPGHTDEFFADTEDAKFYEVTMEERKTEDAFLVTGNQKHFPVRPFIITPRQMMELLGILPV